MPVDSILVIDAGTSALRACLVGQSGAVTPLHASPWRLFAPDDTSPFGREIAADDVISALAAIAASADPYAERIAGITITSQREGVAFVDQDAKALLVSPNIDARAAVEGIAIDGEHADAVYRATGHLPSLMQVPAKYRWLEEHRPRDAAAVAWALPLADWLAATLTGETMVSASLGVENGMLELDSGEPAAALWQAIGAPTRLVPPVALDGTARGAVRDGPLKGMPVAVSGADTQCALLGMDAADEGAAGVPAGWSAPLQYVVSGPILDARRRTWTGRHVVSEQWVLESNAGDTGRAWDWITGLAGMEQRDAEALVAAAPPGSNDVIAVLGPATMRADAMAAGIGGVLVPLPLAISAADRASVLRAVLESTAFGIRANLEQIEEIAGRRVEQLRLGGGMSRSATFYQIVADVIDRDVLVAESAETSAVGAAVLAAPAFQLHDELSTAVRAMVRARCVVRPDPRTSALYDDVYARWLALSRACEEMTRA